MKGGPRNEAAKVQRKEVPGTTQLRSHERRCAGQKAVTQWSMGGWSHRLHSKVAQGRRAAPGQEGRPRAGGQRRGAWAAPASKKRVPGEKTCRQRGQPPPRPTRAKGGGWEKHQQKWARGGAAYRASRKNNRNSKIHDNKQVENSESSKNRSKNK